VIHNGIISNYAVIKKRLLLKGYVFSSETDTEVIPHMIVDFLVCTKTSNVMDAWSHVIAELEGTWSLVMIDVSNPLCLYVAKHGSPLLMAYTDNDAQEVNDVWFSSEPAGFGLYAQKYVDLADGTILMCNMDEKNTITLHIPTDLSGLTKINTCSVPAYRAHDVQFHQSHVFEKTPMPFQHWTDKEIHEQPEKLWEALNRGGRLYQDQDGWRVKLGGMDRMSTRLNKLKHLILTGCGTSYHAALFALPVFRQMGCFTTVQAIDAGEFTVEELPLDAPGSVGVVVISQSGETKDCQRVMSLLNEHYPVIGVINSVGSWIARQVDCGVYLNAGREVGVASTKSFSSQVVVLSLIALWFSQQRGASVNHWAAILSAVPSHFQQHIGRLQHVAERLCPELKNKNNIFLLGRRYAHALSLEGALKLKELTYQNAEGYPGGALKHGPFALIDAPDRTPVFLHVWRGFNQNTMLSAAEQVYCRGAHVILMYNDQTLQDELKSRLPLAELVYIDCDDEWSASLVSVMLYQFLALKLAIKKGFDPDYPRNLAKVVTVDG